MSNIIALQTALRDAALRLEPSATARRDAELLLMHVLGCDRAYLLTHPEMQLTAEQAALYERVAGAARTARAGPVHHW